MKQSIIIKLWYREQQSNKRTWRNYFHHPSSPSTTGDHFKLNKLYVKHDISVPKKFHPTVAYNKSLEG